MVYIIFYKEDCPNLSLYNYLWFYSSYFYKLPRILKYNLMNFKFGQFFESISKSFKALFLLPQSITMEYNLFYKTKYERYLAFVNS